MYSFGKCLLSKYYLTSTVLGFRIISLSWTNKIPALVVLKHSCEARQAS